MTADAITNYLDLHGQSRAGLSRAGMCTLAADLAYGRIARMLAAVRGRADACAAESLARALIAIDDQPPDEQRRDWWTDSRIRLAHERFVEDLHLAHDADLRRNNKSRG